MAVVPESDVCPHCEDGFIIDVEANTATPCSCRRAGRVGRRVTQDYREIPKRYRHVSFDRPPVTEIAPGVVRQVQRFVRDIDENLRAGRGLWFEGGNGTGKTTLASLVCKAALDAGRSVAVYSTPALMNAINRTMSDEREHYTDVIDRLIAVDLLHIDDLGAERTNPWVLEQLYAIVNGRYEEERSLIVTTNLDRDALMEQVTPRTVSRIEEMCEPIPLFGDDQRSHETRLRRALRQA